MKDKRVPSMWLVDFALNQPVLANITFVILMIVGVTALFGLPRDINPDVSFETALIITPYPGATPEDVEKLVTIPIEDEIKDVKDISRVISTSEENLSSIVVEFKTGSPIKERVRDIRDEVDKVRDLPEEVEDTEIIELDTSGTPVITVALFSGTKPEYLMKDIAEDIQDELEDIPGVSSVEFTGVREREIWINVDQAGLEHYGLSLTEVARAINLHNRDFPAGRMDMGPEEILVRTMGEYRSLDDIPETIVRFSGPGKVVRLKDIAAIEDTFEKARSYTRLNGQPGVGLSILKEKDADTHTIVRQVRAVVSEYLALMPNPPDVTYINDMTVVIDKSLGVLVNNAVLGLIMVVLSLMFFIGFRNAIMAGLGIPFCYMLTFAVMSWMGITLNGVTIFSLVLVLGIVVDDAIVIIENIYRYLEKGLSPMKAARYAGEVAGPVISSVTTTMSAFFPMLLMVGIIGKFMSYIPMIVIIALGASLLEALVILPIHMADFGKARKRPPLGDPIIQLFQRGYKKLILVFLKNRGSVIIIVLSLAVVGIMLIPYLGIEMFADEEFSQFSVRLEAPEKTSLAEMDRIISEVERTALTLPREEVTSVLGRPGVIFGEYGVTRGTNVGEVVVDLVEKEDRDRSLDEILEDLRARIGTIPGIRSMEFHKLEGGPPVGEPVAVRVKGRSLAGVEPLVEDIENFLKAIPGIKDIKNDRQEGKYQLSIKVDARRASQYGLTATAIGSEIRAANDGVTASVFRDGDEEVDIVVKLSGAELSKPASLGSLKIATPSGSLIPLRSVTDIDFAPGPNRVYRRDFERAVSITADVDAEVTTSALANQAFAQYIPGLLARYPRFKIEQGGEYEKTQESFASLGQAFLIALLMVYMILGIQFRSFFQPLVIMLTVPFAFIGVVTGLLVNGHPFSLVAFVAVVALAGIVVNDSLILVDFINKRREEGISVYRAIVRSGIVRMRPVLMTSLTTILGLLPMSLSLGGESVVWKPMADSIIWGLVFSTMLTLFVIPVAYSYLAEWTIRFGRKKSSDDEY